MCLLANDLIGENEKKSKKKIDHRSTTETKQKKKQGKKEPLRDSSRQIEGQVYIIKYIIQSGPEVIKLFSCSTQLSMKFSLLINMKMPTIVGIFIFMSRENFMLRYA